MRYLQTLVFPRDNYHQEEKKVLDNNAVFVFSGCQAKPSQAKPSQALQDCLLKSTKFNPLTLIFPRLKIATNLRPDVTIAQGSEVRA
ncbi:TPA: hypothetical protein ACIBOF_002160 [Salmonella enterica subsp. diarizonae serovar 61:r:-]